VCCIEVGEGAGRMLLHSECTWNGVALLRQGKMVLKVLRVEL